MVVFYYASTMDLHVSSWVFVLYRKCHDNVHPCSSFSLFLLLITMLAYSSLFLQFIKIPGGGQRGVEPPAFQQAERQRIEKINNKV